MGKALTPRKFLDHRPYEGSLSDFERVPDIDARRSDYEILSWELEPGDCIVFHMKTLHGAPCTAEHPFRRRASSTRWLGDDALFATPPFPTSPPFPDLTLKPGEPMDHELFPVVWSRVDEQHGPREHEVSSFSTPTREILTQRLADEAGCLELL